MTYDYNHYYDYYDYYNHYDDYYYCYYFMAWHGMAWAWHGTRQTWFRSDNIVHPTNLDQRGSSSCFSDVHSTFGGLPASWPWSACSSSWTSNHPWMGKKEGRRKGGRWQDIGRWMGRGERKRRKRRRDRVWEGGREGGEQGGREVWWYWSWRDLDGGTTSLSCCSLRGARYCWLLWFADNAMCISGWFGVCQAEKVTPKEPDGLWTCARAALAHSRDQLAFLIWLAEFRMFSNCIRRHELEEFVHHLRSRSTLLSVWLVLSSALSRISHVTTDGYVSWILEDRTALESTNYHCCASKHAQPQRRERLIGTIPSVYAGTWMSNWARHWACKSTVLHLRKSPLLQIRVKFGRGAGRGRGSSSQEMSTVCAASSSRPASRFHSSAHLRARVHVWAEWSPAWATETTWFQRAFSYVRGTSLRTVTIPLTMLVSSVLFLSTSVHDNLHPSEDVTCCCSDRHLGSNLVLAYPPSHRQPSVDHFQACSKMDLAFLSSSSRVFSLALCLLVADTFLPGSSGLCLHVSLLLVIPSVVEPCIFTQGLVQEVSSVQTLVTHRACFSTEPWEVSPRAGSATAYALRGAVFVKGTRDGHLSVPLLVFNRCSLSSSFHLTIFVLLGAFLSCSRLDISSKWRRDNSALITTLPVLDCLNFVQHLQPRCLEDRFDPSITKRKGTAQPLQHLIFSHLPAVLRLPCTWSLLAQEIH